MRVSDDDVTDVLRENLKYFDHEKREWAWFRAAYSTDFWSKNLWNTELVLEAVDDGLPFKIEANTVYPFVEAMISNLFYRDPQTQLQLPEVFDSAPGRPKEVANLPDIVSAYLDAWLKRSGIRIASEQAYSMALMYGMSAFKLGIDKNRKGSTLTKMWARALPPWEVILDRNTSDIERQAFCGHIRYERKDDAEALVGADIDDEYLLPLNDYLMESGNTKDKHLRLAAYVRVLEFYDLIEGTQRFFLIRSATKNTAVVPIGKELPLPFEHGDGRPALPIVPVILCHVPEKPLQGLSAVKRVYRLAAEKNLFGTVVVNSARRDAARVLLHKEGLSDEAKAAISRGRDLELVEVTDQNLDRVFHNLQVQPTSTTIDKSFGVIQQFWGDTANSSEMLQGKGGSPYRSATDSSILAGYGEATISSIQQKMADAMAYASNVMLAMTAAIMPGPISVLVAGDRKQLTKEACEMPWTVGIVDAASTPVKDLRKKESFIQVEPMIQKWATIAFAPEPAAPAPQAPGMPPAPPAEMAVPPAVRRLAQEVLNYVVKLWNLPPNFSYDSLASAAGGVEKKPEPPAEDEAEVRSLLERVKGPMGGGGAADGGV